MVYISLSQSSNQAPQKKNRKRIYTYIFCTFSTCKYLLERFLSLSQGKDNKNNNDFMKRKKNDEKRQPPSLPTTTLANSNKKVRKENKGYMNTYVIMS